MLVNGDVHVAWMRPFGQSRHGASPSSALLAPAPSADPAPPLAQMQSFLMSVKMFSLFRCYTCHVTRTAWDWYFSSRNAGRDGSGVYTGVPCVWLK